MNDLTPQISQGANDPAAIASDGQSVSPKPIDQLIRADQYLNNRAAINNHRGGLYFSKFQTAGNPGCATSSAFNGPFYGGG